MNKKETLIKLAQFAKQLDSQGRFAEADAITQKMIKISGIGDDQNMLDRWLRSDPDESRHKPRHRKHLENLLNTPVDEDDDPDNEFFNGEDNNSQIGDMMAQPQGFGEDQWGKDVDGYTSSPLDLGFTDDDDEDNLDFDSDPYGEKSKDRLLAYNLNVIKLAKKKYLSDLAKYANALDAEGRFAEANSVTEKILRLADTGQTRCMHCREDGSRRPLKSNLMGEVLCTKCIKDEGRTGFKQTVKEPSSDDKELSRQYNYMHSIDRDIKQKKQEDRGEIVVQRDETTYDKLKTMPNGKFKTVAMGILKKNPTWDIDMITKEANKYLGVTDTSQQGSLLERLQKLYEQAEKSIVDPKIKAKALEVLSAWPTGKGLPDSLGELVSMISKDYFVKSIKQSIKEIPDEKQRTLAFEFHNQHPELEFDALMAKVNHAFSPGKSIPSIQRNIQTEQDMLRTPPDLSAASASVAPTSAPVPTRTPPTSGPKENPFRKIDLSRLN